MYLVFSVCFLKEGREGREEKKQGVDNTFNFSLKLPHKSSDSYTLNLFSVVFMFFFKNPYL